MRYMSIAAALALAAGLGLTAASAQPSSRQQNVRIVEDGGRTVYTYTDEYGRRHTRVIIQRRSYLDPGTAALPSDRSTLDYVQTPTQHATGVLDNTVAGTNQTALPGPFTLPFPRNPWLSGGYSQ